METRLFERLTALIDALELGLVERRQHVRLALLAALAGEHTLLIGPPGTAKSELSRRLHTAFCDARYFERLLTRFSVPEELFGPLSIRALEEDRYERQTAGFLPEASIAFIDEVFKANSAILNALLTLLNEREFDNGAGRQRCPLISVIGATNAVPEDEVGEAFFDRFLLRLPVAAVSDEGFDELLKVSHDDTPTRPELALDNGDLDALTKTAERVALPADIGALLGELRRHCAAESIAVSDRRWVKTVWLLRVAAATSGRSTVSLWDLLLLPWCIGPDAASQTMFADWLGARLGVREAFSPALLTRVVEAFEAQLDLEGKANDLDYDERGRLKFSAEELATDIAGSIGDAKGGSAALRMTYTRRRRYGARHVEARVRQIDGALARIAGYAAEVATQCDDLATYRTSNLWLDEGRLDRVSQNLVGTAAFVAGLTARLTVARSGFLDLPRLDVDDGVVPEPVAIDDLAA
ncbi:MAG TPA: AAA family ATPase [Rhodocyclaceae bacterium]|nr:AAA family ATPase [Rhodocyclaceae bacterium]